MANHVRHENVEGLSKWKYEAMLDEFPKAGGKADGNV